LSLASPAIGIHIEYDCHGWTVKNNVIYNIGADGGRHNPTTGGLTNRWLNNTVYNTGGWGLGFYSGNAVIENNIIDNGGYTQIYVDAKAVTQGNLTIDYNDYWDSAGGVKVGRWNSPTLNFSAWKSTCNCDSHSLNSNPLFLNPPSSFDLQL